MCRAEEFFPWLKSLKNPKLKNVNMVVTQARHHAQMGDKIRRLFVEGTGSEDLAVNITMEDDPEYASEDEEEVSLYQQSRWVHFNGIRCRLGIPDY
jgi:predicted Rossmann-fold nucleotide-binding protein